MSSEEISKVFEPYICTVLSPEEIRHEPCWVVRLSDGITVYSKYGRSSWLELKEYLRINTNKWIVGLSFRFRDHNVDIHSGADDYLFSYGADGYLDGPTYKIYYGGYRVDDKVKVFKYMVPELEPAQPFESYMDLDHETVKRGLIVSNKPQCGFKELNVEKCISE